MQSTSESGRFPYKRASYIDPVLDTEAKAIQDRKIASVLKRAEDALANDTYKKVPSGRLLSSLFAQKMDTSDLPEDWTTPQIYEFVIAELLKRVPESTVFALHQVGEFNGADNRLAPHLDKLVRAISNYQKTQPCSLEPKNKKNALTRHVERERLFLQERLENFCENAANLLPKKREPELQGTESEILEQRVTFWLESLQKAYSLGDENFESTRQKVEFFSFVQTLSKKEKALPKKMRDLIKKKGFSEIGEIFHEASKIESLDASDLEIKTLPNLIYAFTSLKELNLSSNQLTHLPAEIQLLKNLKALQLENNRLTVLPQEIGFLQNLEQLNLEQNRLSSLPNSFAFLKKLTSLNISGNTFEEIPPPMLKVTSLKELNASNNRIADAADSFRRMKTLRKIDLSDNRLTEFPRLFSNMKGLTELNLSSNLITKIPETVNRLKGLKHLQLNGKIGASKKITSLKYLPGLISLVEADFTEQNLEKIGSSLRELKKNKQKNGIKESVTLHLEKNPKLVLARKTRNVLLEDDPSIEVITESKGPFG